MRKKYLSKTYLRDIDSYEVKFIIDDDKDYYVAVKKMKKMKSPFVARNGLHLIDNGTFMVEVMPKNENYNMRVYLSEEKQPLEFYFDITRENGIDAETKIPYYDDLYTDVIIADGEIRIDDENELLEAYQNGEISKEDFDLANETTKNLVAELEKGINRFKNMDINQFLN